MDRKPVLCIYIGDASGIGPEIVAKLVDNGFLSEHCLPLIIGDIRVMEQGASFINRKLDLKVIDSPDEIDWSCAKPNFLNIEGLDPAADYAIGVPCAKAGKYTGDMLKEIIKLAEDNVFDGFVFAPLNKTALKLGGYNYASENEILGDLTNSPDTTEMSVTDGLWSARICSHVPFKDIVNYITKDSILKMIKQAHKTMVQAGISSPRIAVCGLNPHNGENGTCGREEIEIIEPAVKEAVSMGINAMGPYSADTIFIKAFAGEYDIVVSLYHDQGQIAMKVRGIQNTVTVHTELPFITLTPSHGTAYDIAGKGIADTGATEKAVILAAKMASSKK